MDYQQRNITDWWQRDNRTPFDEADANSNRNSTSTAHTFSSGYSDSFRFSRAPSLASSHTSCSSSSQLSRSSWLTTSSYGLSTGHNLPSIPSSGKPTLKQKQAANLYACSHCDLTFSKKADRKKHILDRCPFLGDGILCSTCPHISRNEHQADRHRKDYGHSGHFEAVTFSKRSITCSKDGTIYHNLKDFLDHFSSSRCILNHFDGNRYFRSRLRTLLSEGRDDINGHSYIYAALMRYCEKNMLTSDACNTILDAIPSDTARILAEKLEWGCVPDDGSSCSRLGYTNFDTMVAGIMFAGNSRLIRTLDPQGDSGSVPAVVSARKDELGTLSQTSRALNTFVRSANPTLGSRRNIPPNFINTSKALPLVPASTYEKDPDIPRFKPLDRDSPAVTATTAILRQDLLQDQSTNVSSLLAAHQLTHSERSGSREKRPRSVGSPPQQGRTTGPKAMDLRASPQGSLKASRAYALEAYGDMQLEADNSELTHWPEYYSLSPPLTARNLAFAIEHYSDGSVCNENVKQRRQGGIWDLTFDELVSLEGEAE